MRLVLWLFLWSIAFAQQVTVLPESFIEYEASRPGETWTGRVGIAQLELNLLPDNVRASSLSITIHPADFNSGNFLRDTNARRTVFETKDFPDITFVATRVATEGNVLKNSVSQEVRLEGDLTMHGVTQTLDTTATVTLSGNMLTATGTFQVKLTDFNMSRPTLFGIVANDEVILRFDIRGTLTSE